MDGTKRWNVAKAKQRFSELIRATQDEPQLIFSRERLVAAVVDPATFREFQALKEREQCVTLAEAFAELRRLCAEERFVLEVSPREDRANAFADALNNLSR